MSYAPQIIFGGNASGGKTLALLEAQMAALKNTVKLQEAKIKYLKQVIEGSGAV